MHSKNAGFNHFVFTPQVSFKFAQNYDAKPSNNVNDVEINEHSMDANMFECSIMKKRFLSSLALGSLSAGKNQINNLQMLGPGELLPIEAHRRRIKTFEKMMKREMAMQTKEKVQVGGKPKLTFSNIVAVSKPKSASKTTKISDKAIIRGGGSNHVLDGQEYSERLYCRIKDIYNLSALSIRRHNSADILLKNLENNFHIFEKIVNK